MTLRQRWDRLSFAARAVALLGLERIETGVVFNPTARAWRRDPHAAMRTLRARDPLHRSRLAGGYVLSRYDDCVAVLSERHFSADERNWVRWGEMRRRQESEGLGDPYEEDRASMLRLDPPDHSRLRGLVSKAFTPRAVERMRPRIAERLEALLSGFGRHGSMELISDFAAPLPIDIIAAMLGVPAEDRDRFRHWSDEAVKTLGESTLEEMRVALRAMDELGDYIESVAEQRRSAPRDDLLSGLVAAEEEGDRLTSQELKTMCVLLLVAGNETTTKLVANSVVALCEHRDQLALLRDEPKRIAGAIDELLRYDGPVQLTSRFVTRPGELSGVPLQPGQQLVLLLAAANRDPAVFDDPDRLDVTRENVRHLAFGYGTHFCLGAQLARLEATLALEALVKRFPDLRLADGGIEWGTNTVLRGPVRLPLRF